MRKGRSGERDRFRRSTARCAGATRDRDRWPGGPSLPASRTTGSLRTRSAGCVAFRGFVAWPVAIIQAAKKYLARCSRTSAAKQSAEKPGQPLKGLSDFEELTA